MQIVVHRKALDFFGVQRRVKDNLMEDNGFIVKVELQDTISNQKISANLVGNSYRVDLND